MSRSRFVYTRNIHMITLLRMKMKEDKFSLREYNYLIDKISKLTDSDFNDYAEQQYNDFIDGAIKTDNYMLLIFFERKNKDKNKLSKNINLRLLLDLFILEMKEYEKAVKIIEKYRINKK